MTLAEHLRTELERYYPDLTDFEQDFLGERIRIRYRFAGSPCLMIQEQFNVDGSDEEWFEFRTDSNRVMTLPLFIEN